MTLKPLDMKTSEHTPGRNIWRLYRVEVSGIRGRGRWWRVEPGADLDFRDDLGPFFGVLGVLREVSYNGLSTDVPGMGITPRRVDVALVWVPVDDSDQTVLRYEVSFWVGADSVVSALYWENLYLGTSDHRDLPALSKNQLPEPVSAAGSRIHGSGWRLVFAVIPPGNEIDLVATGDAFQGVAKVWHPVGDGYVQGTVPISRELLAVRQLESVYPYCQQVVDWLRDGWVAEYNPDAGALNSLMAQVDSRQVFIVGGDQESLSSLSLPTLTGSHISPPPGV